MYYGKAGGNPKGHQKRLDLYLQNVHVSPDIGLKSLQSDLGLLFLFNTLTSFL